MKNLLIKMVLMNIIFLSSIKGKSQDTLLMNNTESIYCIVKEITLTEIKYKTLGPIPTHRRDYKKDVATIKYSNGTYLAMPLLDSVILKNGERINCQVIRDNLYVFYCRTTNEKKLPVFQTFHKLDVDRIKYSDGREEVVNHEYQILKMQKRQHAADAWRATTGVIILGNLQPGE